MVGGGGGLLDFSVSPRPLGFGFLGFRAKGLGPGLDNMNPSIFAHSSEITRASGLNLILLKIYFQFPLACFNFLFVYYKICMVYYYCTLQGFS